MRLLFVLQIIGAVAGAALEALLVPGLHLGRNSAPVPGCFVPNVTNWELFFWELVLTFVLIYVIYAVAIASPGHGNMGPLAAGLTVLVAWEVGTCCMHVYLIARALVRWIVAFAEVIISIAQLGSAHSNSLNGGIAGSQYGAAAVNPARLLGPALVFFCTWRSFWIYLLGEVVGAILAAAVAVSQYGTGGNYESGFRGYSFAGECQRSLLVVLSSAGLYCCMFAVHYGQKISVSHCIAA